MIMCHYGMFVKEIVSFIFIAISIFFIARKPNDLMIFWSTKETVHELKFYKYPGNQNLTTFGFFFTMGMVFSMSDSSRSPLSCILVKVILRPAIPVKTVKRKANSFVSSANDKDKSSTDEWKVDYQLN